MADPQSQPTQSTQAPAPQTVNPTVLGRSTDPVRPSNTTRIDVTPPTQTGQSPPPVQFGGGNDVDPEYIIREEKSRIASDIVTPIEEEFEKLKIPLKKKGYVMGDSGIYMPAPGDFLSPSSLKGPDALDLEQEMRHELYNMGNYLPTVTATPINIPGGSLVTKFQEWFDETSGKFTENARAVAEAEYQAAVGQQRAQYQYQMYEYSKAMEEYKKAQEMQTLISLSEAAERGSPGAEMQLERFLEDKTLTVEDLSTQPASAGMRAQAVPDNASVARMMSSDGSKLLQITLAPKSSGGGTSIDATPTMQTMAQNTVGSAVEQLQKAFQNPAQQQAIENWNQMVGNKVTKSDVIIDPNSPGAYQTYLKESGVEKQLFQEAQRTTINPGAYLPGWVYDAQIQGKTAVQQNAPVAPLQDFGTIFTPQAYQDRFEKYSATYGSKNLTDFLGGGSFESAAKFMGEGKSVGLEPSSRSVVHINDEPFFYTSYGSSGYELRDMTGQIRSAGSGDIPADVLEREMNKIKTQSSPKVISTTSNAIYKDVIDKYAPKPVEHVSTLQTSLMVDAKQPGVLGDNLVDFGDIFTTEAYKARFDNYTRKPNTMDISQFIDGSTASAAKFMGEGQNVGRTPTARNLFYVNDDPYFYTSYGKHGYEVRDSLGQIRSAGSGDVPLDAIGRELGKLKDTKQTSLTSLTANEIYKDVSDTYAITKPVAQQSITPGILSVDAPDFGDIFTTGAYKDRFDRYVRKPNTMDISQFIDGSTFSAAQFMGEGQNVGRTPDVRKVLYINDEPYFYSGYGKNGYEVRDARGQIRSAGSGNVPVDAIERELEKLKDTKQSSLTSITTNEIYKDIGDVYNIKKPVGATTTPTVTTPGVLDLEGAGFGDIFTTKGYKDRFDSYVRKPGTKDISEFIDGSTYSAALFMGEGQNVGRIPEVRKVMYINDEPYFYSGYGKHGYEVRDVRGQIRSAGAGNIPEDAVRREIVKLADTKQSSLTPTTANEIYRNVIETYAIPKSESVVAETKPVETTSLEGTDFGGIFSPGMYKSRFDRYARGGSKPGTIDLSEFIDGSTFSAALFMGEGQNVGRIPEVRKVMYINDEPYFYSGYGKHGYEVRDVRGQIRSAGAGNIPIDAVQREIEKLADTKQSSLISPSLNLMYKDEINKYTTKPSVTELSDDELITPLERITGDVVTDTVMTVPDATSAVTVPETPLATLPGIADIIAGEQDRREGKTKTVETRDTPTMVISEYDRLFRPEYAVQVGLGALAEMDRQGIDTPEKAQRALGISNQILGLLPQQSSTSGGPSGSAVSKAALYQGTDFGNIFTVGAYKDRFDAYQAKPGTMEIDKFVDGSTDAAAQFMGEGQNVGRTPSVRKVMYVNGEPYFYSGYGKHGYEVRDARGQIRSAGAGDIPAEYVKREIAKLADTKQSSVISSTANLINRDIINKYAGGKKSENELVRDDLSSFNLSLVDYIHKNALDPETYPGKRVEGTDDVEEDPGLFGGAIKWFDETQTGMSDWIKERTVDSNDPQYVETMHKYYPSAIRLGLAYSPVSVPINTFTPIFSELNKHDASIPTVDYMIAEYGIGEYEGLRERPLEFMVSTAIGFAIPGIGKGVGVVAKGLPKVAKIASPLTTQIANKVLPPVVEALAKLKPVSAKAAPVTEKIYPTIDKVIPGFSASSKTEKAITIGGYAIGGLYGVDVATRVASAENPIREFGAISAVEIAPMSVGIGVGSKLLGKVDDVDDAVQTAQRSDGTRSIRGYNDNVVTLSDEAFILSEQGGIPHVKLGDKGNVIKLKYSDKELESGLSATPISHKSPNVITVTGNVKPTIVPVKPKVEQPTPIDRDIWYMTENEAHRHGIKVYDDLREAQKKKLDDILNQKDIWGDDSAAAYYDGRRAEFPWESRYITQDQATRAGIEAYRNDPSPMFHLRNIYNKHRYYSDAKFDDLIAMSKKETPADRYSRAFQEERSAYPTWDNIMQTAIHDRAAHPKPTGIVDILHRAPDRIYQDTSNLRRVYREGKRIRRKDAAEGFDSEIERIKSLTSPQQHGATETIYAYTSPDELIELGIKAYPKDELISSRVAAKVTDVVNARNLQKYEASQIDSRTMLKPDVTIDDLTFKPVTTSKPHLTDEDVVKIGTSAYANRPSIRKIVADTRKMIGDAHKDHQYNLWRRINEPGDIGDTVTQKLRVDAQVKKSAPTEKDETVDFIDLIRGRGGRELSPEMKTLLKSLDDNTPGGSLNEFETTLLNNIKKSQKMDDKGSGVATQKSTKDITSFIKTKPSKSTGLVDEAEVTAAEYAAKATGKRNNTIDYIWRYHNKSGIKNVVGEEPPVNDMKTIQKMIDDYNAEMSGKTSGKTPKDVDTSGTYKTAKGGDGQQTRSPTERSGKQWDAEMRKGDGGGTSTSIKGGSGQSSALVQQPKLDVKNKGIIIKPRDPSKVKSTKQRAKEEQEVLEKHLKEYAEANKKYITKLPDENLAPEISKQKTSVVTKVAETKEKPDVKPQQQKRQKSKDEKLEYLVRDDPVWQDTVRDYDKVEDLVISYNKIQDLIQKKKKNIKSKPQVKVELETKPNKKYTEEYVSVLPATYAAVRGTQYMDEEEVLRLHPENEAKELTNLRASNYIRRPRDVVVSSQLVFDQGIREGLSNDSQQVMREKTKSKERDDLKWAVKPIQANTSDVSFRSDVMTGIRQDTRQDTLRGVKFDVAQAIHSRQDTRQKTRQDTRQKTRQEVTVKPRQEIRTKTESKIRVRPKPEIRKIGIPGFPKFPDGKNKWKSHGKSSTKTTRTVWDIASPDAVYFGGTKRKRRGDDLITAPIKQIGITNIKLPVTKLKNMKS